MLIVVIIPFLIILAIALFTLVERKVLAGVQRRVGPSIVGVWGLLQPFADAFKLIFKETVIPGISNLGVFVLAPIITFMLSLVNWSVIPLNYGTVILTEVEMGILFIFAVSSLGVYGIIMAGWASNSKYAFLGALRSAAQMISYEVSIGLVILIVVIYVGSLNLTNIVMSQNYLWNVVGLWPCFLLFFVSALAETNRVPFDLPEAESELVSGYNVEYSSITFALFFLAEYSNIMIMSSLITLFFLGGWLAPFNFFLFNFIPGEVWFLIKFLFVIYLFIVVRGTLPRYRYDQLMSLGWKVFLPLSLSYFFIFSILFWGGYSVFLLGNWLLVLSYLVILYSILCFISIVILGWL